MPRYSQIVQSQKLAVRRETGAAMIENAKFFEKLLVEGKCTSINHEDPLPKIISTQEITIREAASISGLSEYWLRRLITSERGGRPANRMEIEEVGGFAARVSYSGCNVGDMKQRTRL